MKKVNSSKTKKKGENYTAVILEKMSDDIKLIAEGQIGVQRQLDEFRDEMLEFKRDTESNFQQVFEFKHDTESNFQQVFEYLSRIEDEISEIKEDLKNNYEKKGWDKKWRETIEKKLEKIEKALNGKKLVAGASV